MVQWESPELYNKNEELLKYGCCCKDKKRVLTNPDTRNSCPTPLTTQQYRKSIQAAHFWEIISKVTDDLSSNDKTKKLKHKHSYTIGHGLHICICCLLPYSRGGEDLTFGTHWQHNYWSNNNNQICIDKEWRALSMNLVKACRGSIHRGAALD